ncbi:LysM peptidoglycan-binding domain-containing protein [Chloroflexota bacterium]
MKTNHHKRLLLPVVLLLVMALLLPMTAVYANDNDNRLSPHHAEYYTVYCVNDYVDFYLATGTVVHRVLVARVMGLSSEGGTMGIGRGMTVTRWHDEITASGYNGNAAPLAGYKTFSLRQCLDTNGNTPNAIRPGTGSESGSGSGSGSDSSGTDSSGSVVIPPAGSCVHVVRAGETVYAIAKHYNTTIYNISVLNHLVPSRIYTGQHLTVPDCNTVPAQPIATPPPPVPVHPIEGQTHVLQSGQTLYSVARSYNVSVSALMSANGITDPTRVPAGIVLRIP